MKAIIYIFIIISLTLTSCNENPKPTEETQPKKIKVDSSFVEIPHITIDSIILDQKVLNMFLTDSKSFFNKTLYAQTFYWYSYQIEPIQMGFDSIKVIYQLPNRDGATVTESIDRRHVKSIHTFLDKSLMGAFMTALYKVNWMTRNNYSKTEMSLIDRINSLFARKIQSSNYRNQFPNNDEFFGINGIEIFEMYFQEVLNKEESIGHDLINALKTEPGYFVEEDLLLLERLISNYTRAFARQNGT